MDARPRLLDQVRDRLRTLHYSYRTEQTYLFWIRRFILFNDRRHPSAMGGPDVERFLTHLAVARNVSASTQSQALSALLFLYRQVLQVELPWLENIVRARPSRRLPVVLTTGEVRAVLAHLRGEHHLVAILLYGGGLRLMEALRLRVKDVNFAYQQVLVRDGKGGKDRVTILPDVAAEPLRLHLEQVKERHRIATERGYGGVELPQALARKYPGAHLEWGWQYVFPAERPSRDPRSGVTRRHHLHEESMQRAVRTVQELLGHKDVKTTQIYTHVMRRGANAVRSPLDG